MTIALIVAGLGFLAITLSAAAPHIAARINGKTRSSG
jgi:hypothetical protein